MKTKQYKEHEKDEIDAGASNKAKART
jgi:tRNA(Ser,Leu) C12 N-acetylase TAN1